MERRPECCRTCKKVEKYLGEERCAVLLEFGDWGDPCSAWTDDPDWESKVEEAVKQYRLRPCEGVICGERKAKKAVAVLQDSGELPV